MTDWISVDDRLPERTDLFCCAFDDGGVWHCLFARPSGQWRDVRGEMPEYGVTHWMPLPDHPKESA